MKPAISMSPMKSPHKMPAVAQARSVINRLQRLTDSVNRSAAAMSTYALENQQAPILAESRAVRAHMTSEAEALQVSLQSLLGHLKDLHDMRRTVDSSSAREAELKTQVAQLQTQVASLREGDLTLEQAMVAVEASQVSTTSSQGDRPSPVDQKLAQVPVKQSTKIDSDQQLAPVLVKQSTEDASPGAEAGGQIAKQSEQSKSRKRDSHGVAKVLA